VDKARSRGARVLFATNNSSPTRSELVSMLSRCGIEVEGDDLVTSAQAAASLLEPGWRAVVCGGDGLREALEERGVRIVEVGPAEAALVGFSRSISFDDVARAADAARAGALLVATNEDATFPTKDGLLPGAGAWLAAVCTASGARPVVAGKPHAPMVELIRERAQRVALVAGDRPSTDGLLAKALGARFALVRSMATPSRPHEVSPDVEGSSLAEVVDLALGEPPG
jgi:glycerol 3-phosphatase-2